MSVIDDFVEVIRGRIEDDSFFDVAVSPTRQGKDPNASTLENVNVEIKDKLVVLEAANAIRLPEYDRPGNPPAIGHILPVVVTIVVNPSEKSDLESWIKTASTYGSTAQNAITGVTAWHTLGGNAIDCEMGVVSFNRPEGEELGSVFFAVGVKYRVSETNFETIRA